MTTMQKPFCYFLAFGLIVLLLLFELQYLSVLFSILFILLLIMVLFTEEIRIFIWQLLALFTGLLILMYSDALISKQLNASWGFIMSQFLLLIPVLLLRYVVKKFKKTDTLFKVVPSLDTVYYWKNLIFIWVSSMVFFLIAFSVFLSPKYFGYAIVYSVMSGLLQEYLWRNLILNSLMRMIETSLAIIIVSLASGVFFYALGFSIFFCNILFVFGIIAGFVAHRTKSIFLPVLLHSMLLLTMILTGELILPY